MFKFKNATNHKIVSAFAYFDRTENMWFSEGWWSSEDESKFVEMLRKIKR
jgi:uncharacterized membrane protein